MAQEFAKSFYNSQQWKDCRESFLITKLYLCERCKGFGNIAHHKEYLTPENIDNPEISLNWDNLECVCQDCHNLEHNPVEVDVVAEGLMFDAKGQLIQIRR